LRICAVLSVAGGVISWFTVGGERRVPAVRPADLLMPCHDPGRSDGEALDAAH